MASSTAVRDCPGEGRLNQRGHLDTAQCRTVGRNGAGPGLSQLVRGRREVTERCIQKGRAPGTRPERRTTAERLVRGHLQERPEGDRRSKPGGWEGGQVKRGAYPMEVGRTPSCSRLWERGAPPQGVFPSGVGEWGICTLTPTPACSRHS